MTNNANNTNNTKDHHYKNNHDNQNDEFKSSDYSEQLEQDCQTGNDDINGHNKEADMEFSDDNQIENSDDEKETEITDVATLQKLLAEANTKVEEFKNHYLMAKAESDNIQKRSTRDIENAHKYALDKFVPDLLAIKDSLELGTKAAKEAMQNNKVDINSFIEGSEMTINMFNDALTKQNVVMVNPNVGDDFSHELHQAITMLESNEIAANKIIDVVQKGYQLNERLIRPALVIVAKAAINK